MYLHGEDTLPKSLVWVDAQEALAQDDEARDMLHGVRRKIVQLDPIDVDKSAEERMQRQGESLWHMVRENHPFITLWAGHNFIFSRLASAA